MSTNSAEEATKPSAKKSKLLSKLATAARLPTRRSKPDTEPPPKAKLSRQVTEPRIITHQDGTVTPRISRRASTGTNFGVQAPSSSPPSNTRDVKALRERLVKSRLSSVSRISLEKFRSEFGKSQDGDDDDNDTKTSGQVHPCMHRTWELLEFCVLKPLKCLADSAQSLWNDQQPGKGKAINAGGSSSSDDLSSPRPRTARGSAGTLQIR